MHDSESDRDEKPKLKVVDRRLFDSEGNLRDGVEAEEPSADTAQPSVPAAAGNDAAVEAAPAPAASPDARPDTGQPTDPATVDPALPLQLGEEALMRFVEEQYIGGLLALGAMPDPQTGQTVEDLDLAQVRIEVIAMVQERAGDNLPPEARKGLDDVMYQLRMAYLQKSKVAKL